MCIILYKPAGKELPGTKTLRNCFTSNPDGAGIMYPAKDGGVQIVKGIMTLDALYKKLGEHDFTNVALVVHFRIGTHGHNDATNTHPFPVTRSDKQLVARISNAPVAIAHNGIISLTSPRRGDAHSDTYYFVRDYAALAITRPTYYKDRRTVELLSKMAQSKLAIMSEDGHVELVGHFERDKNDGCFYSNRSYQNQTSFGWTSTRSATSAWVPTGGGVTNLSLFGDIASETLGNVKDYDFDEDEYITGSFVPASLMVHDENTGYLVSGDQDMFVYDKDGHVYLYDDEYSVVMEMEGHSVVTPDMEARKAANATCQRFHLVR